MHNEKWEVTIQEFRNNGKKRYKVTRRLHDLSVSETRIYSSKEKALKQLEDCLR